MNWLTKLCVLPRSRIPRCSRYRNWRQGSPQGNSPFLLNISLGRRCQQISILGSRNMATELSLERMKQLVLDHFEDFVKRREATVIRSNMPPDFYDHDGPGGKPAGIDVDEKMMVGMYKLMPDLHLTIEDIIAEGDKVVCRNIWHWTDA